LKLNSKLKILFDDDKNIYGTYLSKTPFEPKANPRSGLKNFIL